MEKYVVDFINASLSLSLHLDEVFIIYMKKFVTVVNTEISAIILRYYSVLRIIK